VDRTLAFLSLALQNVPTVGILSRLQVDEVQSAAIYLSAAVMECLTSLIDWVNKSRMLLHYCADIGLVLKKVLQPTLDFDDKLRIVRDRVGAYTNALLVKSIRSADEDKILEWIWPKEKGFLKPLDQDSVGNTCRWFFES